MSWNVTLPLIGKSLTRPLTIMNNDIAPQKLLITKPIEDTNIAGEGAIVPFQQPTK